MKKIILCLMATCLSLMFVPIQLSAGTPGVTDSKDVPRTAPPAALEVKNTEVRFDNLRKIDNTELKMTEKKDLRKEASSNRRANRDISGGVYISAGVLVVIIIVLIILL
jgi:hypothetical protein